MISTNHYKSPGIEYLTYKYSDTQNIMLRNKHFVAQITERKEKSLDKLKKAVAKLDEDIDQVGTIKVFGFMLSAQAHATSAFSLTFVVVLVFFVLGPFCQFSSLLILGFEHIFQVIVQKIPTKEKKCKGFCEQQHFHACGISQVGICMYRTGVISTHG